MASFVILATCSVSHQSITCQFYFYSQRFNMGPRLLLLSFIWLCKLIYPGQVIQKAHLTYLSQNNKPSLTESFHQLLLASSACRPGDVRGRCA